MTEEAHAKVSTTGPGGGFAANFGQPGVRDIHISGVGDDVKLPAYQTALVIAAISIAMLVNMAAVIRWYWVVDTFISRNMASDFRPNVLYWIVVLIGFIALCVMATLQRAVSITRDLPTLAAALIAIAIVTGAYAVFAAPIITFALRDWIVMAASGMSAAVWVGVRLLYIGMTKKITDPLTMEDSNTRVALANNQHAIDMYLLRGTDENRKDQLVLELQNDLDAMREQHEAAQAALRYSQMNPLVRYVPSNHGGADGSGLQPVDETVLSAIVNIGFREGDISRATWIKRIVEIRSDMLPDHMNTDTVARDAWEAAMHTLRKWRFVSGAPNKPRMTATAETVVETLKLPPYPTVVRPKI